MKRSLDQMEHDIEKFRFELADELGIVERADKGRSSRKVVERCRPPFHRHLRDEKERP